MYAITQLNETLTQTLIHGRKSHAVIIIYGPNVREVWENIVTHGRDEVETNM